jgi:hypothetical protein
LDDDDEENENKKNRKSYDSNHEPALFLPHHRQQQQQQNLPNSISSPLKNNDANFKRPNPLSKDSFNMIMMSQQQQQQQSNQHHENNYHVSPKIIRPQSKGFDNLETVTQDCANCSPMKRNSSSEEKGERASCFCADCGNIFLCEKCSQTIHRVNLFASHRITRLPAADKSKLSSPFGAVVDENALRKNHEERKKNFGNLSNNSNNNLFSPEHDRSSPKPTEVKSQQQQQNVVVVENTKNPKETGCCGCVIQ